MILSKAFRGFDIYLRSEGYSNSTLELYTHDLLLFIEHLGDKEINEVEEGDLVEFFVYLREVYHKQTGRDKELSGSTLQNYWKAIRTFFGWAKRSKYIIDRPDINMMMPRNNPRVIMPFEEAEVKALLKCAEYTKEAQTLGRAGFKMKRYSALRDVALLVLLLDTGLRAGEAGRLTIEDINFKNEEIFIQPFGSSMRKTKSRVIPLGKSAKRVLWDYMVTFRDGASPKDPVFMSKNHRPMNNESILQLVRSLGKAAGVKNAHPHRLRHTFAIQYLRNGGDIFTLKSILGHSTLDMVQHYLQLANTDATVAHRKASPADKWHL